jgi:hypothetical protein
MTAFLATAGQHLATIGRLHAFTKSVNALAAARMGLECTFHDSKIYFGRAKLVKKALPANRKYKIRRNSLDFFPASPKGYIVSKNNPW